MVELENEEILFLKEIKKESELIIFFISDNKKTINDNVIIDKLDYELRRREFLYNICSKILIELGVD